MFSRRTHILLKERFQIEYGPIPVHSRSVLPPGGSPQCVVDPMILECQFAAAPAPSAARERMEDGSLFRPTLELELSDQGEPEDP